jgi:hypothetical protein
MFFPWGALQSEVGEAGNVAGALITSFNTALNLWLSNGVSVDRRIFLAHSATNTPDVVTAMSMDDLVATQRRRLRS